MSYTDVCSQPIAETNQAVYVFVVLCKMYCTEAPDSLKIFTSVERDIDLQHEWKSPPLNMTLDG